MSDSLTNEELLDRPIRDIVDGWAVNGGRLYLWVKVSEDLTQTLTIPRPEGSKP